MHHLNEVVNQENKYMRPRDYELQHKKAAEGIPRVVMKRKSPWSKAEQQTQGTPVQIRTGR